MNMIIYNIKYFSHPNYISSAHSNPSISIIILTIVLFIIQLDLTECTVISFSIIMVTLDSALYVVGVLGSV